MAPKKNNFRKTFKAVKKVNQVGNKPVVNTSLIAAPLPKQMSTIYFNDGSPDVWIIKGKQQIDDEAAKEGVYDFLVSRTRVFGRAPKSYLYHARAIAVPAFEAELKERIQSQLEFWKTDRVLYCNESGIALLSVNAFLAETLTSRTNNAMIRVDTLWGIANRLTNASTEADILARASPATIYKIDLAFQSANDSFERSEKESIRVKSIACKILNERLGPNALAAGRASLDAQDYPQAYEDVHMHFLNSSVHSTIHLNQQLINLAMKKNELLNVFLRRAYDLFKMIHVGALIANARAALPAGAIAPRLNVIPGLDQAFIERICTLNSDAQTRAQPAPFDFFVTGDLTRVTHILSGLRHDPDDTFKTCTDQFANQTGQSMRLLVSMLEAYTQTFDYSSKRAARQKALKTGNTPNVPPQPSNNNRTGKHCKWCKENRPKTDATSHNGPECYFNPDSPKYKGPRTQNSSSNNKEKLASALKVVQKLQAKEAKDKANAKAAKATLKAISNITEAEIVNSSEESD